MLDDINFWKSMQHSLEKKMAEYKDDQTISACEMQSCLTLIEYCRKRIGGIMADKLKGETNAGSSSVASNYWAGSSSGGGGQ